MKESSTRTLSPGIVPDLIGLDKITTSNIGIKLNMQMIHKGMGVVSSQTPPAGSTIEENTIVKLEYSPPTYE